MITLPDFPPRRAFLLSFWIILSCGFGLAMAILMISSVAPSWGFLALVTAVLAAALGITWPQFAALPYRAWNKIARLLSEMGRFWILSVCYYTFFFPVGSLGSQLKLAPPLPNESFWVPREGPDVEPQFQSATIAPENFFEREWTAAYVSSCREPGRLWALFLLPFLLLLRVFEIEDSKSSVPANIYTLY
jgi:hypothetical protein